MFRHRGPLLSDSQAFTDTMQNRPEMFCSLDCWALLVICNICRSFSRPECFAFWELTLGLITKLEILGGER